MLHFFPAKFQRGSILQSSFSYLLKNVCELMHVNTSWITLYMNISGSHGKLFTKYPSPLKNAQMFSKARRRRRFFGYISEIDNYIPHYFFQFYDGGEGRQGINLILVCEKCQCRIFELVFTPKNTTKNC